MIKRMTIAVLLTLVALSGVGSAWADPDSSDATSIDSIQEP